MMSIAPRRHDAPEQQENILFYVRTMRLAIVSGKMNSRKKGSFSRLVPTY
jgi:hypothetical protein